MQVDSRLNGDGTGEGSRHLCSSDSSCQMTGVRIVICDMQISLPRRQQMSHESGTWPWAECLFGLSMRTRYMLLTMAMHCVQARLWASALVWRAL